MPSLKFGGMKFLPSDMSAFLSATLLVAVNELRRSARAKGMSFYKYGMYFRNVGVLYHHLYLPKITGTVALFQIDVYKIYLSVFPIWLLLMY